MTQQRQPMIDLTDLVNDRREISVTLSVRGEPVEVPVVYNPGVFSDEFMNRFTTHPDADIITEVLARYGIPAPNALADEIVSALGANQSTDELTGALVAALIEIEIAMDGKPMPITAGAISKLSVPVRSTIIREITEDIFPDSADTGANPTPAWAKKKARKKRKKGSFGGG